MSRPSLDQRADTPEEIRRSGPAESPSDQQTLRGLACFLTGSGGGEPLVTMQEWVTGMALHGILGKYPLHIFKFLPKTPDPAAMTPDERHETALTIAEAFFRDKLTPSELKKMVMVVSSDKALKYYLFAALRNWTHDKIRVAAQSDDMLHLGMRIEKTLRRFTDLYLELFHADNWRDSIWTRTGSIVPRKSPPGAVAAFRNRCRDIRMILPAHTKATRYRPRLVSTPALSNLLLEVFDAVGEPMSILELLAIISEKIPVTASAPDEISSDLTYENSDGSMIDHLPDLSLPDESALIDRFDLPACVAAFLDSLDEFDLQILRHILDAAFSGKAESPQKVGKSIIKKLSVSTSTYYFRKERLKRRLSEVLSDQDEFLFYRELRSQLESRPNVTFKSRAPS